MSQDPADHDYIIETSPPVRTLRDVVREYLRAVDECNVLLQFQLRREMQEILSRDYQRW